MPAANYAMHSPKVLLRAPRRVYCRELVALGLDPLCDLSVEVLARVEQARDRAEDSRQKTIYSNGS
jgi:hypothetical protein